MRLPIRATTEQGGGKRRGIVLKFEMTPPYKIELYDANGNAQLLNVAWSFEAAERVVREHVGGLGPNEVIRIRDSAGALVLSTDPNE
jgi:hypothetical protein